MGGLEQLPVDDRAFTRAVVQFHLAAAGRLVGALAAELRRQDEDDEAERDRDYRWKMAAEGLTVYGTPARKRRKIRIPQS